MLKYLESVGIKTNLPEETKNDLVILFSRYKALGLAETDTGKTHIITTLIKNCKYTGFKPQAILDLLPFANRHVEKLLRKREETERFNDHAKQCMKESEALRGDCVALIESLEDKELTSHQEELRNMLQDALSGRGLITTIYKFLHDSLKDAG